MSSLQKKYLRNIAITFGSISYVIIAASLAAYSKAIDSLVPLLIALSPCFLVLIYGAIVLVLEIISDIINSWRIRGILDEHEFKVYQNFSYETTLFTDKNCEPIYLTWDELKTILSDRSHLYTDEQIKEIIIIYEKLISKMKICPQHVFFS